MENLMLFRNTSQSLIDAFVYFRAKKSRKQSLGKYGFDKITKLNTCDIKTKKVQSLTKHLRAAFKTGLKLSTINQTS